MAKREKKNGTGPLDQLKDLYQFMVDKGLSSVEFTEKDFHVRLVRQGAYAAPAPAPSPSPLPHAGEGARRAGEGPAAPEIPAGAVVVKSPMMGIFYRASSPSSPPYAKEGDAVKKGQVMFLIEAMKVFNEIRADFDCRVVKILTENGKPVRAGQALVAVERL